MAVRPVTDVDAAVSPFIDSLWLEEGLSRNTLDAYRRDLAALATWLAGRGLSLNQATEADLQAYFAERHAQTRATGDARAGSEAASCGEQGPRALAR